MRFNQSQRLGAILIIAMAMFLFFDAGMKIAGAGPAIDATEELGFSPSETRVLGIVLALATVLYVLGPTRVLGAVLLTGYLGGAVAIQARHGSPLFSHVFFGVYLGIAVWGAMWLRDDDLRLLIPLRRRNGQ